MFLLESVTFFKGDHVSGGPESRIQLTHFPFIFLIGSSFLNINLSESGYKKIIFCFTKLKYQYGQSTLEKMKKKSAPSSLSAGDFSLESLSFSLYVTMKAFHMFLCQSFTRVNVLQIFPSRLEVLAVLKGLKVHRECLVEAIKMHNKLSKCLLE